MNLRRIPIVPTLLVMIAAGIMIRLGFWQLDRLEQKAALAALFSRNQAMSSEAPLPADKTAREKVWFRHTTFTCLANNETRPMAGHNLKGETGWAQWGQCLTPDGKPVAEVNVGWSISPAAVPFTGGTVGGTIAPDGPLGARVVAGQPLPGLQPSAPPDPGAIPNNHLSYAVQWFLFAATALIIYGLALRKRLAAEGSGG
ncbi:SURF1 family protein [Novosphingobium sp.]|uniref:SURF1 family protein n=1 Tax=Novosphingobium sp. TaxID=1874826 RepID=UPI0025E17D3A|nr:SURF1 family cytochrome oxidase biogenesis protein [Novosphingobium sp.]